MDPETIRNAFRTDEGGTPEWNFVEMMQAGKSYLDLPVPRKLIPGERNLELESLLSEDDRNDIRIKRSEAQRLLRYMPPEYISAMAKSDIGSGTDPKRSEDDILNKKKQVLKCEIFATCLFDPGSPKTDRTVHTIIEDSRKSHGRKIDFGISGAFEGVQVGGEVKMESSVLSRSRRVIAMADLKYQWATTEARIHEKLSEFLTNDCRKALGKINNEGVYPSLARDLSRFIEEYGTHVVLKCTHGYRMVKVETKSVKNVKELKAFKAGEYQENDLVADGREEDFLDIKSIGSKEQVKKAFEGGIEFEEMIENCGEEGDAGVISHDSNMMIASMLHERGSPYKHRAAKRLQYWTRERINDLNAGWGEGLFATSYKLKFVPWAKKISDKKVRVVIESHEVFHHHPGKDTDRCVSHVTNVHTNEAKVVKISVVNDELELKKVLASITVFRRVLSNRDEGAECLVLATKIDTSLVDEPECEWELFDLGSTYNYQN
jgi:hypothetical protein